MSAISETLIATPTIGLEDIQRAAFYAVFEGLNNALSEIQSYWESRDQRFNEVTGADISLPVTLELLPPKNFHEGHKPSLINSIPDSYPNVAVFGTRADPGSESNAFDQMNQWVDSILIEAMVKGRSGEEDIVNRRIQRTIEAIALCLDRNPTLGGAVMGSLSQPSVIVSDLFAVRSPAHGGAYGDRFLWQGAQITFRVTKDSVMPSSGPGAFSGSSSTDYSRYIDQG